MTLAQTSRFPRSPFFYTVLMLGFVVCALIAGVPFIKSRFPDYMPGYLIQIPAMVIIAAYAWHYKLFDSYKKLPERLVLLLAFAVPLQNTFIVKAYRKALLDHQILMEIFRPDILVLCGLGLYLAFQKRRVEMPLALRASAWTAIAGWIIASVFSDYSLLSLGHGFFEIAAPWIVLYVMLSVAPDRAFLLHAISLFGISFALVVAAQTAVIWPHFPDDMVFRFPVFADEFLTIKKDLPLMMIAGGNGYGNTDNFASLMCLVAVAAAGLAYCVRPKWAVWLFFALVTYGGLMVYPRSVIGAVVVGLVGLWIYRLHVFRSVSPGIIISIALIAAIHISPSITSYYLDGVRSFIGEILPYSGWANQKKKNIYDGASGLERAEAWKAGVEVARDNWKAGVGYGVYRLLVPKFTAAHSMVLQRLDEGGILSLISLLLLAGYAFTKSINMLLHRKKDMAGMASIVAISAFLLKGLIFGASFAIMGMVVWGFGIALLLATSIIPASDTQ